MSSYDNVSPEPKNLFLAQLLVDDQLAGHLLIQGRYLECIKLMYWIVTRVSSLGLPKGKIEPLSLKLQAWTDSFNCTINEIRQARLDLSALLSENFYSDLHLGLIHTSTLPETKQKPANTAISPDLSSRL
jgi:hypothetical protein